MGAPGRLGRMIVKESLHPPVDELPDSEWRAAECLVGAPVASVAQEGHQPATATELAISADAAAARRAASRRRGAR
jgi:hypothetical protein